MKALDVGAYGNTRQEALNAVAACRYPPEGIRSFGPIRAALYAGSGYAQDANRQIACIAMIETKQALDNLEDILSTPGLDGVYIGPADLALALGFSPDGDNTNPIHEGTVNKIFETARSNGLAVGIHTWSVEFTKRYLAQGFHFVTLGSEMGFMAKMAMSGDRRQHSSQHVLAK